MPTALFKTSDFQKSQKKQEYIGDFPMPFDRHTECSINYSSRAGLAYTFRPVIATAFLGLAILLVNCDTLMAAQLISATKVIVIDSPISSVMHDSESKLTAIGGTRAKAIGGTQAKAIGGTRAKAIGGTRAKAIGGTRAKAIGGTRVKAIGGTRLLAAADTRDQSIPAGHGADTASSLNATPTLESTPISFMGEEYDWIAIGPLQPLEEGKASVLGYTVEFGDDNAAQTLFNRQSMVVIGKRHADENIVSLETNDTFVSGVTEVVTTAQVKSVDTASGQLTLTSGVVVDYTQLLSNQDQPIIYQGDFVFVQGYLY